MTPDEYLTLKAAVIAAGHGGDIDWAESVKPPANADVFAREAIYVIMNSGMKWEIARKIFDKIMPLLYLNRYTADLDTVRDVVATVFGHKGKTGAIAHIWRNRAMLFKCFNNAPDKVAWCETLPWIGPITKYHLAKNLGVDCAKPDRWLERIAEKHNTTTHDLCASLSNQIGDRIATVDVVLWRAAAIGLWKP